MEKIKRDVMRLREKHLLCNQTDLINMLFTKEIINKSDIDNLIVNFTKEIKILKARIKQTKSEEQIKEYEEMINELKENDGKQYEVCEWWLVSKDFALTLYDEREPILNYLNCYWWGRCETNEEILEDELLLHFADLVYGDDDF